MVRMLEVENTAKHAGNNVCNPLIYRIDFDAHSVFWLKHTIGGRIFCKILVCLAPKADV